MQSPFEVKNRLAARLDRLALWLVILISCILYFLLLFRRTVPGMIAGLALFTLIRLTALLFERSTLTKRDRLLRERIGGTIALTDLILMPDSEAQESVCRLLCAALHAEKLSSAAMRYAGEVWLVRLSQKLPGSSIGEGDVLSAHRAMQQAGAERVVLLSTGNVSPSAVRAAEWVDPPVRLVSGAQLSALFGRLHPATDEDIARHIRRQKKPFSFSRMRLVALTPAKQKKYLLVSFLLLVFYLMTGAAMCLFSCLLAFLLALFCQKENSRDIRSVVISSVSWLFYSPHCPALKSALCQTFLLHLCQIYFPHDRGLPAHSMA